MIFSKTSIAEKHNKCIVDRDQDDHQLLLCKVILQSFKNNVIKIIYQYKINEENKIGRNKEESQFSCEVLEAIAEYCAFVVTDTAALK